MIGESNEWMIDFVCHWLINELLVHKVIDWFIKWLICLFYDWEKTYFVVVHLSDFWLIGVAVVAAVVCRLNGSQHLLWIHRSKTNVFQLWHNTRQSKMWLLLRKLSPTDDNIYGFVQSCLTQWVFLDIVEWLLG